MGSPERKALIRERHLALLKAGLIRNPKQAQHDALAEAEEDAGVEIVDQARLERVIIEMDDEDE